MASWTLLLCVTCLVVTVVATVPQLPTKYHVKGNIYLPEADVYEPFEAWVNPDKGMSRIDYYNGDAQIINRGDVGQYGSVFKIVYETTKEFTNQRTCFAINGSSDSGKVMPQGVFPDITGFTATNLTVDYKGMKCMVYYHEYMEGTKKNAYTLLINENYHMPKLFRFIGYDNVFGSHYDEYVFEYDEIDMNLSPEVFDIYKSKTCISYPGPGLAHVMHANPMFELVGSPDHDKSTQSAQMDKHFEDFKEEHNKNYHDNKEHEQRKSYFRHNFRFIDSNNRKSLTYSLAVNHLADLTDDEMKIMRGYRPSNGPKGGIEFTTDLSVDDTPDTWDWRIHGAVSHIKDQGICGSCWSFGTTGTIEGAYFLKHKMMLEMSEQALMDCSWGYGNNGCDGGESFRAYEWIMDNDCIPTEESYGMYLQQDGYCHNKDAVCGAVLTNYSRIPSGDLDSLRIAIATHGPVAIAIDASQKSFTFYGFGVYYDEKCGNKEENLDHEVLAIGYGTLDNKKYWLVKNSWSHYWGNQGYILMSQQDNNCGVATDADYAMVK